MSSDDLQSGDSMMSLNSEVAELRRQNEALENKLIAVSQVWQKAFTEFKEVRLTLQAELDAHEQTKMRLKTTQRLMDTVKSIAAAGVEEYNTLKQEYARESAEKQELLFKLQQLQNNGSGNSSSPTNISGNNESNFQTFDKEQHKEKVMSEDISNVYLIPTLTEMNERLENNEKEIAIANKRAAVAEANLERIQAAAVNALEEFNQLKKKYSEEFTRRQEAEKAALEYKMQCDGLQEKVSTGGGKKDDHETLEKLRHQLETERQFRKLAENDVANLQKQLDQKQGKQFDLMTLTELEVKLENANRSLEASNQNCQRLENQCDALQKEVNELRSRMGESVPLFVPPPPPPPPVFVAVHAGENLKKRIGALKNKLQGEAEPQADPLTDLRAQAMAELQQKLQQRTKKSNNPDASNANINPKGNEKKEENTPAIKVSLRKVGTKNETKPENKNNENTQMANLVSILQQSKDDTKKGKEESQAVRAPVPAPRSNANASNNNYASNSNSNPSAADLAAAKTTDSRRKLAMDLDDTLADLERELAAYTQKD